MTTSMLPIALSDQDEFLSMATKHFSALNPSFVPQDDWKEHYFTTIMANPECFLRWIICDEKRAGFILMGLEKHRFLPRKTGAIYDLYVSPEFRGRGVAQACGEAAIRELWTLSPSKIQIELANGQSSWAAFWKSLGFKKATERFVLERGQP
jgi:ribosomal protein S18 acetylase RimI-like enzyme